MVSLSIVCAALLATASSEMKLSEFPCYKPKPPNHRAARIVGGSSAHDAPYYVGLMKHGGVVCGASIISENFLILAAHCVCNNLNNIVKLTQFQVFVGMTKLSDMKQPDENHITEVFIRQIIVHPDYVCGEKTENDIALLHIKSPIKFNRNVQPVCLSTDDAEKEEATVSGFGWTNEDLSLGEKPDNLQSAVVPIWNNNDCQESYISLMKSNRISENQLCAGGRDGGLDSCWSDSGGPLVNRAGNLIGIVSTGVGCARKGLPGIYTRISRYTNWIKSSVQA